MKEMWEILKLHLFAVNYVNIKIRKYKFASNFDRKLTVMKYN